MPFRKAIPVRSAVEARTNYRAYKEDLRRDFASRCGYCDALDEFFGGLPGYQIDHFAPKSKFPEWVLEYKNLVYCCPYCNRAKSNKWIGGDKAVPNDGLSGFVDPCDPVFDEHLDRDNHGRILPKTALGRHILANLNLSLIRHQLIWQTQRMDELLGELLEVEARLSGATEHYRSVLEEIVRVSREYREYRRRVFAA